MIMYKIWIDLDGVLVNWHAGACKHFDIAYPSNFVFTWGWLSEQTGLGTTDLLASMDAEPEFWRTLEPTAHAGEIISYLDSNFPDWGILSSATRSGTSWGGKAEWVFRYLGRSGMDRLVICCGDKARFAYPKAVLIDDRRRNIDDWMAAGGVAFHWVEYSSDMTHQLDEQSMRLTAFLNTYRSSVPTE